MKHLTQEAGHFDLTFVIVVVAISLIVSILVGVWLFELDV